jgi:hypothetical protein
MKRSELKEFIKGEIVTSLSEASPEDVDNQKELNKELEKTAKLSKDLGLEEANIGLADLEEIGYTDGDKAVAMHFNHDVIGINSDVDFQSYRKGFIQGVNDATIGFSLNEEAGDDDDVDAKAIKAAKGARGKHKKLDLAVKALKNITTEMKSLARDYSKADGVEKEKIKDKLKLKTPKKKELEALVAKLEKDVV